MSLRNEATKRTTAGDKFRWSPFDSHQRATPPDASSEALAAQTAEYLARGRSIQQIPAGVTAFEFSLRPDKSRASAGGKKGGAAKKGLPNRGKKSEIRMEDGL